MACDEHVRTLEPVTGHHEGVHGEVIVPEGEECRGEGVALLRRPPAHVAVLDQRACRAHGREQPIVQEFRHDAVIFLSSFLPESVIVCVCCRDAMLDFLAKKCVPSQVKERQRARAKRRRCDPDVQSALPHMRSG